MKSLRRSCTCFPEHQLVTLVDKLGISILNLMHSPDCMLGIFMIDDSAEQLLFEEEEYTRQDASIRGGLDSYRFADERE